MKKKLSIILSLLVLPILFSVVFVDYNVYADQVDPANITKKWILTQYTGCATSDVNSPIKKDSSTQNTQQVAKEVMKSNGADRYLPSFSYSDSFSTADANRVDKYTAHVNCNELFVGASGLSNSALSYTDINPRVTWNNGAEGLLEKMGYKKSGASDRVVIKGNISISPGLSASGLSSGEMVIASIKRSGSQNTATLGPNGDFSTYVSISNTSSGITIKPKSDFSLTSQYGSVATRQVCKFRGDIGKAALTLSSSSSLDDVAKEANSKFGGAIATWSWSCGVGMNSFKAEKATDTATFTYQPLQIVTSMKKMFDVKYPDDIILTKAEKLTLYQAYVKRAVNRIYGSQLDCESESSPGDGWTGVQLKTGDSTDTVKTCYLQLNNNIPPSDVDVSVQIGSSSSDLPRIEMKSLQFVIDRLNEASAEDFADALDYNAAGGLSNNSSNVDGVEPTCENSGAAESLGWIVCPILSFLSNASQTLYDEFVEPALQVDPKLFANGPTDGTRDGWDIFRNIANTFFIIILLIVIFSQLTGVGIDNYGIKKILPKLILAALLINLSYLICVIFVDLSNIVGNGIQQLFNSMGEGLTISEGDYPIDIASQWGSTAITGVVILGVAVVGIWSVVGSEGIVGLLMVLLIAAISVIVALFFLFLLLAAREAAIVVLTVISPLAFVCLMLPNTKSFFDKWWKFGGALLLVYPIAGLLVGGGNFVSKLLLVAGAGTGGFFSAFMAMIISVVPIFFIPTVLKNSFQALGNLGAKISSVGKTASSRLTGATDKTVKGSERWKNYQTDRGRQRKINAARRTASRYMDDGKVRAGLSNRQQRRLAQAMSIQLGEEEETRKRENLLHGGFDAAIAGIESSADAASVKNVEAMLGNGRVGLDSQGNIVDVSKVPNAQVVNTNDATTMGRYYAKALEAYGNAVDDDGRKAALAQIKAAQNIMSKTDKGRTQVQNMLADATRNATTDNQAKAVQEAAAHLMSEYGDTYKSKNRGANEMITDLATSSAGLAGISGAQSKLGASGVGNYAASGAQKYTAESLAGADDAAIDNLAASVNTMSTNDQTALKNTAYEALHNENIQLKPEVEAKLKNIVGNYVPPDVAAANAPRIQRSGAFQHRSGRVVQLHEMSDGTFIDAQSGQTVDITHYKRR